MREAQIKAVVVKEIQRGGGYARRIEDQYGVGILDLVLVPKGMPVFMVEAKIARGAKFAPSPRQYVELARIESAASPHLFGMLMGWKDGTFYFHEAAKEAILEQCYSFVPQGHGDFERHLIKFYEERLKRVK